MQTSERLGTTDLASCTKNIDIRIQRETLIELVYGISTRPRLGLAVHGVFVEKVKLRIYISSTQANTSPNTTSAVNTPIHLGNHTLEREEKTSISHSCIYTVSSIESTTSRNSTTSEILYSAAKAYDPKQRSYKLRTPDMMISKYEMSFNEKTIFKSRYTRIYHIAVITLVITTMILTIARLPLNTRPNTRSDTIAIVMVRTQSTNLFFTYDLAIDIQPTHTPIHTSLNHQFIS